VERPANGPTPRPRHAHGAGPGDLVARLKQLRRHLEADPSQTLARNLVLNELFEVEDMSASKGKRARSQV
jgi:hypothetical protein